MNCECDTWCRDYGEKVYAKHHRNCRHYDLETDCYVLISNLLQAMRDWGNMEDGIPEIDGIADAYNEAAAAVWEKTID